MTPDGVVFDCDGVLVDTQRSWDNAYASLFRQYGARISARDRRALVGLQLEELGRALADLLHHVAPPRTLGLAVYALVESDLCRGCAAMPGAIELVRAASGIRPLAVASNAPASIVRSYLAPFGILDAFDVIVGSTDVRSPKPAPDVYLLACERLRVRPARAVAVEDSPVGVASARAAQLRVVGIPSARDLRLRAHAVYDSLDDPNVWHELGVPRPVTVEST